MQAAEEKIYEIYKYIGEGRLADFTANAGRKDGRGRGAENAVQGVFM